MHIDTPNTGLDKVQLPAPYAFKDIHSDRILKVLVNKTMSKVTSMLNLDIAHLHPLCNIHGKYQKPTPYHFPDKIKRPG